MSENILSRSELRSTYRLKGRLSFETGLHVGGGSSDYGATDKLVMRDASFRPYIPGSSLKGAMRAAVERIAPMLDLTACGVFDQSPEVKCLTPKDEDQEPRKSYRMITERIGESFDKEIVYDNDNKRKTIQEIIQNAIAHSYCSSREISGEKVTETTLLELLDCTLCDVCKAFGAPVLGSAIYLHDAYIEENFWIGSTQVRDGVGIDRDSGRAVDGIKYDYEVVPAETAFAFSMTVESDDPKVLGMAALALHELCEGNISLGGIKSRGLGRCKLDKDGAVETVHMNDRDKLIAYLRSGKKDPGTIKAFVKEHLLNILPAETT